MRADYAQLSPNWLTSNPKGLANFYEDTMRPAAEARLIALAARGIYASVDDVPPYDWKSPLQRCIQILKRYRDVMFKDNPDVKPISMIITTLAARAYNGETDLFETIRNILQKMPLNVGPQCPRVMNPVDPGEDFADKWREDKRLEPSFRQWHAQAYADIEQFARLDSKGALQQLVRDRFEASIETSSIDSPSPTHIATATPVQTTAPVIIQNPPRPWGDDGSD